jgi:integrase
MAKRPNQYGIKRRGKKWTARPWVPGRGHIWAGTHDSEHEALQAALRKIEEERRLPATKETVATFCARWIRDYPRNKESTNDRYRADAARFAKAHGSHKLHEIDKPTALAYVQKHPHDHAALRAMYGDAEREGLALRNPFSNLRIGKGRGRRDIVAVTPEELDRLADLALASHDPDFGPVFRSIIIVAAYTGLRPGELFGLDRSDVDFEAETLHVRQQFHKRRLTLPKSNTTRTVFLPPPAAQALRELPRRVPEPVCGYSGTAMLFPGKLKERITQSALSTYWKPVRVAFEATLLAERLREFREAAGPGKPAVEFYGLRHFCATYLIEQGVESWIVAKQLGHSDGGGLVEQVYGHPRDEVARERLRKVFGANVKPLRATKLSARASAGCSPSVATTERKPVESPRQPEAAAAVSEGDAP